MTYFQSRKYIYETGKRNLYPWKIRDSIRLIRNVCILRLVSFSTRYAVQPTILLLMECFVRARNPEEHSRPSRERPLYMGGPFFLRMHYISLVKFTLRTTGVGPDGRIH